MKSKYYIATIITMILIIILSYLYYSNNQKKEKLVTINQQVNNPTEKDSRCKWMPGDCKNLCEIDNKYIFNPNSEKCEKYDEFKNPWHTSGCCTPPQFSTIEECRTTCE